MDYVFGILILALILALLWQSSETRKVAATLSRTHNERERELLDRLMHRAARQDEARTEVYKQTWTEPKDEETPEESPPELQWKDY